jgi:hypothetical protein
LQKKLLNETSRSSASKRLRGVAEISQYLDGLPDASDASDASGDEDDTDDMGDPDLAGPLNEDALVNQREAGKNR